MGVIKYSHDFIFLLNKIFPFNSIFKKNIKSSYFSANNSISEFFNIPFQRNNTLLYLSLQIKAFTSGHQIESYQRPFKNAPIIHIFTYFDHVHQHQN